jgi:hypothetical protein
MKTLIAMVTSSVIAMSLATTAGAATKGARAQQEASCKAQAAKKYSAVRFLARRDYVKTCMGQASKKAKKTKARA